MEGPGDERTALHLGRKEEREGRREGWREGLDLSSRQIYTYASYIVNPLFNQPVKGLHDKKESDSCYKTNLHVLVETGQKDKRLQYHVPRLLHQVLRCDRERRRVMGCDRWEMGRGGW